MQPRPTKKLKHQKNQNVILNINDRTPDNRSKAKQKAGSSPNNLEPVPPFPTGETASGSQDKPKYDNPGSKHEPKGNPGRPSNTQPSHNIVKKDIQRNTKSKSKSKTKPKT